MPHDTAKRLTNAESNKMPKIPATYTISLDNMRFRVPVGVCSEERAIGTDVVVAISAEVIASEKAFVEDNLAGAPDYSVIYRKTAHIVRQPVRLLENLAYKVACVALEAAREIVSIEVSVTKINPPVGADGLNATVRLCLTRKQFENR